MMQDAGAGSRDRCALRPRARRRVPGHQRAAGRNPAAAQARRRRAHGRRRRRAGDLLVPGGVGRQHPRFSREVHARGARRHAGAELPFDAGRARRGQRADGRGRSPVLQAPAEFARLGRPAAVRHGAGRAGAGDVRGRPRARGARARRRPASPGRAVPQLRPQRRARARAHAPQRAVREVRRPQVPRGGARQGPARGAALGRTTRATGSRRSACCSCCRGWDRPTRSAPAMPSRPRRSPGRRSRRHSVPAATREDLGDARADARADRRRRRAVGRAGAPCRGSGTSRSSSGSTRRRRRARATSTSSSAWASSTRTRESFVTELTLDPPQATGDLAGDPLLDEDYLVLSTVHSAKGQEWDTVHVLNVTDGSFPSEFSAGRAELLEEERRLLYVAMTRARDELRLMAPVRFYVTQQAGMGDRYVHGARSRFLTETRAAAVRARHARRAKRRGATCHRRQPTARAWTSRAGCGTCGEPGRTRRTRRARPRSTVEVLRAPRDERPRPSGRGRRPDHPAVRTGPGRRPRAPHGVTSGAGRRRHHHRRRSRHRRRRRRSRRRPDGHRRRPCDRRRRRRRRCADDPALR